MIRDDVREYQIVAPCKEDDHSIQIRTGNNGTVFFRRGCSGWHIRGFFDQNGIGGRLQ